ncbi:MAG: hypothetical protein V3T64_13175 [Myxococcota bacterium]
MSGPSQDAEHSPIVKKFCFYHAGCPDGFGAAWSVRSAWGEEAHYIARGHEDRVRPGECDDALVAFVDIAPLRDELEQLAESAAQVLVVDHHVTARDRLASDPAFVNEIEAEGHVLHFDMNHSGAVLAWQYFRPNDPLPDLLRYVEDQDLWNWALPNSEAINAAIASYPRSWETWTRLATDPIEQLAEQGEPILRANRIEVARLLEQAKPVAIGTSRIETVNASNHRSQIGHELATRALFGQSWGLVYRIEGTEVYASIYSIGELDVSQVAARYDGGGHKNASGFHVSLKQWLDEFVI